MTGLLQGKRVNEKGASVGEGTATRHKEAKRSRQCLGGCFVGRPAQRINPEAVVSGRDPFF